MAKPEASLWDYLQTVLPHKGHYSRIESSTCHGFPDVHYTLYGFTGSIELKSKTGKTSFGKKGLRKTQIDWIAEEDAAQGIVWIIAEVDRTVFLINGNTYFEEFNQMNFVRLLEVCDFSWYRGDDFPTEDLGASLGETR